MDKRQFWACVIGGLIVGIVLESVAIKRRQKEDQMMKESLDKVKGMVDFNKPEF